MTDKNTRLIEFHTKYQNKWVAMNPRTKEVIRANKNLKKLSESMAKEGTDYILEKVLPLNVTFIPQQR